MLSIALALAALASATAACGGEDENITEDRLDVTLYSPTEVGLPPTTPPIRFLRFTMVDRDSNRGISQTLIGVDATHGESVAPDIPFGTNLQLLVEGIDANNRVVAYGGTPTFDILEESTERPRFNVYLTEASTVSPLNAVFRSGNDDRTVQQSPFEDGDTRAGHSAHALPDGRVLVIGGAQLGSVGSGLSASIYQGFTGGIQIYDPSNGYFSNASDGQGGVASLSVSRGYHAGIRLSDGRVVVAGGLVANGTQLDVTASAELITPNEDGSISVVPLPDMQEARAFGSAVLRANGDVVVVGGHDLTSMGTEVPHASVELLDTDAGVWVRLAEMSVARTRTTAVALDTGILVVGGHDDTDTHASAEFIANDATAFVGVPAMTTARHSHAATRLQTTEGRYVVVAGGHQELGFAGEPTFDLEVFDTQTVQWSTPTDSQGLQRGRASFELIELSNGSILAAGGLGRPDGAQSNASLASVEVLVPQNAEGLFEAFELPSELERARHDMAAARLSTGIVVLTGGARLEASGVGGYQYADIYNPGPSIPVTISADVSADR